MARLRLNQEYRNKISNRMRVHLEQENTQEKEKFFQLREQMKPLQDQTWKLAQQIVSRHYTPEDIKMAYHLQNKFENVDTIAKDSCFHFGYMVKPEEKDEEDKYITKHFDFRLNGDYDGVDGQDDIDGYRPQSRDFGYAYFRDELKAQDQCNPDITIEMEGKDSNPHWTKYQDANDKYLGNCGRNNLTSYANKWDKEYELDLIGREYCRDRSIACSEKEYQILMVWQSAKGQLIQAHEQWITSVLNQVGKIKTWLKSWKFLDEALDFAKKANCPIDEAEIIRCNSTGLAIFNPLAVDLLEITIAGLIGISRFSTASRIAFMLLPLPEIKIARLSNT